MEEVEDMGLLRVVSVEARPTSRRTGRRGISSSRVTEVVVVGGGGAAGVVESCPAVDFYMHTSSHVTQLDMATCKKSANSAR